MFKKVLSLVILLVLLSSCYTHKIYLNADKKSGKMIIDYTLDNDYLSILSTALSSIQTANDNQEPLDPNILIDPDLFKKQFSKSKDLKLTALSITKSNGYKGHIEITFTDFEKALKQLPENMININIVRTSSSLTVSQTLNLSKLDKQGVLLDFLNQQKEDDIALYNKLTKQAFFQFEIYTPTVIKSAEGVTLSSDKKKATYTFKLNDLLVNKDKDIKFLISF